jgi:hypothetical protein
MTRVNGNSARYDMRLLLAIFTILVAVLSMFGCSAKNDEAAFVLAEMDNPFIGKWQSDIPSANTTLIFDYKPDGTFDYEMTGVPAEQGGVGTGGYAVYDGVMVTWLDFEGAAAYRFEVVDNDTINVTELEADENGRLADGNTAPFTRVEGSDVNKENTPLKLSNAFIGKWETDLPDDGFTVLEYSSDGTFTYDLTEVPEEEGGKGDGLYTVFGDKKVLYYSAYAMMECFSFETVNSDTINVTVLEPDGSGGFNNGSTAMFNRAE